MKKRQGKRLWELAFDKAALSVPGKPMKLSALESDALDKALYGRVLNGIGPWKNERIS